MAPNLTNNRGSSRRGNSRHENNRHGNRSNQNHNRQPSEGRQASHRNRGRLNRGTQRPAHRYVGCGICKSDHRIITCKKFLDMNLSQKYQTVVKLHYCVNCLARNHLIGKCNNKTRCQKCGAKHHSLLHGPQRILNDIPTSNRPTPAPRRQLAPIPAPRLLTATHPTTTALSSPRTKTFVPTAVVQIHSEDRNRSARALLNPSLTSLRIALSFVREADLATFKVDGQVYVKVIIAPNMSSSTRYEVCMLVVSDLPKNPYPREIDESIKEKFCRISLADPEFYSNASVAI